MRDYSILMIHNPFQPDGEEEPSELVKAFTKQIETIYRKRFGLKAELVRSNHGRGGREDGTFRCSRSCRAGIIPAESVLHTSKQICERVKTSYRG